MHTARLFFPLAYDLKSLTFHSVTDIHTLDMMYIEALRRHSLISLYSYPLIAQSLYSLIHITLTRYSLTPLLPKAYIALFLLP